MAVFEKRQMEPVRTSGSTQIPLFQVFSYHQADSNDLESRGSVSQLSREHSGQTRGPLFLSSWSLSVLSGEMMITIPSPRTMMTKRNPTQSDKKQIFNFHSLHKKALKRSILPVQIGQANFQNWRLSSHFKMLFSRCLIASIDTSLLQQSKSRPIRSQNLRLGIATSTDLKSIWLSTMSSGVDIKTFTTPGPYNTSKIQS